MPLPPGTRLGPCEVLAPIGAGGMGEVYRAHDTRLGRDVLLGDLDSALDGLEDAVKLGFLNHRFLGEIDPILAPLRSDRRFQALLTRAAKLRAQFEGPP